MYILQKTQFKDSAMEDKKQIISDESAVVKYEEGAKKEGAIKHIRNGQMNPPGASPMDGEPLETIPMMVTTEDNEIVTMSSNPIPDATSKDYQHKVIWMARYSNGQILTEYDKNGEYVNSENIGHADLREFSLIDRKGRVVISQEITPGRYFFYRKRTALQTGRDVVEAMHLFGWRIPKTDKIPSTVHDLPNEEDWHVHLCVLFESDMHVELGDFDYTPIDPSEDISGRKSWKYPIKWRNIDCVRTV